MFFFDVFIYIVIFQVANTQRRQNMILQTTAATTSGTTSSLQNAFSIVDKACTLYKEDQFTISSIPSIRIGDAPKKIKIPRCATSKPLIVGGEKALPKEFPHMALIGYGQNFNRVEWKCGGTLISDQFVLTAAHCVSRMNGEQPKWVRLGDLNYANTTEDAQPEDFTISKHIVHPNYNTKYYYEDIALLQLNRTVKFSAYKRPLCLHTSPTISQPKGIATGWGTIGYSYFQSEDLLKVLISFVDSKTCNSSYFNNNQLIRGIDPNQMICAGEIAGGKDTCSGDSGGPIQIKLHGEPCMYSQVGITSLGDQFCAKANSPAGYTRIYNYIPWIQSIVWPTVQ